MSVNPKSLRDLGAFWTQRGGVNLGVVGNESHCSGYHLGRDRIFGTCACKPQGVCVPGKFANDYSVQHARDVAGLSVAASAIDLGALGGKLAGLYAFSEWLVRRCQDREDGTDDIREVIYWSVANARVQRWSGIDRAIHWGPGNGDLSHKTHTHISFFRDSEARDKRPLFLPYFIDAPDTDTEDPPMIRFSLVSATPGRFVAARAGSAFNIGTRAARGFADGYERNVVALVRLDEALSPSLPVGEPMALVTFGDPDQWELVRLADGTFLPRTADCTAAVDAAVRPLAEQIERARVKARATANAAAVTVAELEG